MKREERRPEREKIVREIRKVQEKEERNYLKNEYQPTTVSATSNRLL